MNKNSFIAVCGQVSTYNQDVAFLPPPKEDIASILKERNIHREFFAVSNYKGNYASSFKNDECTQYYKRGLTG